MKDFHLRALEQVMLGQTFKMNINNIFKPEIKNWGVYRLGSSQEQENLCVTDELSECREFS